VFVIKRLNGARNYRVTLYWTVSDAASIRIFPISVAGTLSKFFSEMRAWHWNSDDDKNGGKGKIHPRTDPEDPEGEEKYNPTLSLTSALDSVGGFSHAPAALPPGMTLHPLYSRLGGPGGPSGRVGKILPPPVFGPRTVQPVASHYTYWAIPVHWQQRNWQINCVSGR
jgi:hypothetical protein